MSFYVQRDTGHFENSVLNALCFDSSESGKFKYPKQCDTKMPMVVYIRTRIGVYLQIIYTYGVGFGVAVLIRRQYQSLDEWNGKIAVPLFLYAVLKAERRQRSAFLLYICPIEIP